MYEIRKRRLTDNGHDALLVGGLEERGLARDLATELPRRLQVHVPQQDVRLRGLLLLQRKQKKPRLVIFTRGIDVRTRGRMEKVGGANKPESMRKKN